MPICPRAHRRRIKGDSAQTPDRYTAEWPGRKRIPAFRMALQGMAEAPTLGTKATIRMANMPKARLIIAVIKTASELKPIGCVLHDFSLNRWVCSYGAPVRLPRRAHAKRSPQLRPPRR